MNLEKLFESLDASVFTPELKSAMQSQFNEAVEHKAQIIAEDRIDEEIERLSSVSEQHVEFLTQKAEEYVALRESEMADKLSKYVDRVVDDFVQSEQSAMNESVKAARADMILEAFDAMLVATGVEVARIAEAKDESGIEAEAQKLKDKYNRAVNENLELREQNDELIKMGVVAEMCEGMTIVQASKFKRLAEMVEFSRDGAFIDRLETLKQSIGSANETVTESVNKPASKDAPAWVHLV